MHDHPPIVLQAIQALKPHGLVHRICVRGSRVELHLEDGRVLTREIPPDRTTLPDSPRPRCADIRRTSHTSPARKTHPKDRRS